MHTNSRLTSAARASSLHPPERRMWCHWEQHLATVPLLDRWANATFVAKVCKYRTPWEAPSHLPILIFSVIFALTCSFTWLLSPTLFPSVVFKWSLSLIICGLVVRTLWLKLGLRPNQPHIYGNGMHTTVGKIDFCKGGNKKSLINYQQLHMCLIRYHPTRSVQFTVDQIPIYKD